MNYLRKKLKFLIWTVIILFVGSVFLLGALPALMPDAVLDKPAKNKPGDDPSGESKDQLDASDPMQLAQIVLYGKHNVVNAGDLNRMINQFAKAQPGISPVMLKSVYGGNILEQLVKDKLVEIAIEDMDLGVEEELQTVKQQFERRPQNQRDRQLRDLGLTAEQFLEENRRAIRQRLAFEAVTAGQNIPEERIRAYFKDHADEFLDEETKKPKDFAMVRTEIERKLREVISEEDVKAYYSAHKDRWRLSPKIDVTHFIVDPANSRHAAALEPTESEIQKHYEENRESFLGQARVRLRHILIDPSDATLLGSIEVSDADVKDYYDSNSSEYEKPEEIRVARILLKVSPLAEDGEKQAALEKAQAIHKEILDGKDFTAAVSEYSEGARKNEGGLLNWIERTIMSSEFDAVAFDLTDGQMGDPFLDEEGAQILRLVEKRSSGFLPLDQVADDIRGEIKAKLARDAARKQAQEITNQVLAAPETFAEVAKARSTADSKSDGGDLGVLFVGENSDNPRGSEVGRHDYMDMNIQDAISEMATGAVTGPIESGLGYHVLKVEETIDPEPKPLSEVEAVIKTSLRIEKRKSLVATQVHAARAAIEAGLPFSQVAEAFHDGSSPIIWKGIRLDLKSSQELDGPALREMGSDGTLPPPIFQALSRLSAGEISEPVDYFGKTFVFYFERAHPPEYQTLEGDVEAAVRFALHPHVDDGEISTYFEKNKDQFRSRSESTVEWIAFTEKFGAESVIDKIKAGKTEAFDKARNKESHTGFIANRELREIFKDIEPGSYSQTPQKSKMGYVVGHVIKRKEAEEPTLEKARTAIQRDLLKSKRDELYGQWVQELENQAAITRYPLPRINL